MSFSVLHRSLYLMSNLRKNRDIIYNRNQCRNLDITYFLCGIACMLLCSLINTIRWDYFVFLLEMYVISDLGKMEVSLHGEEYSYSEKLEEYEL